MLPLTRRVRENAQVLLAAYRSLSQAVQDGQTVSPAAEWLLDNVHLVEQQLRQIGEDLPPGYYRQLPKLRDGPLAGYPRVLGLAWAYVAHTDSLLSGPILIRFVQAYQQVQPLMIGELWAVAITLRIVLIENMRRLVAQITVGHRMRLEADTLVDAVFGKPTRDESTAPPVPVHVAFADHADRPLPEILAAQIAKRLRGLDPTETPLRGWLEDRLRQQGTTIDDVVLRAHQRQAASNVTMRNIVTSMRLASELDWADVFEAVSLIDARLRQASDFEALDFATRNRYRTAIEDLSRHSALTETGVTEAALAMTARDGDPGHALIGPGRAALERQLGYAPPLRLRTRRLVGRLGLGGYLGAIAATSGALLSAALWGSGAGPAALLPLALTGAAAAVEAGTALINLAVTRTVAPKLLPALDLIDGIPPHLRTLVAVPVILSDADDLARQIERLEVHHLSSTGGALHFALLSDGPDAATETTPGDADLIAAARAGIAQLNETYPSDRGDRFLLLHRTRRWNPAQGCWMGWERKRGKLDELNRLLRGATDTTFLPQEVPQDIRYVITLDADTRLLRDTVRRMIGKMAHPLNRARVDPASGRVTSGYGILQPRVTPALPVGSEGSLFQQVFSSPGGIDSYAAAISDVYQDLFAEGSFTGKGIYDVDAFDEALAGRVPENALLSHDLFEGIFARAALASDIEVVEDFPARFDVAARRQHRWVRGDWQLLPWVFGRRGRDIPAVGRWKMLDNLRRSLTAPLSLAALAAGWMLLPQPQAAAWTGLLLGLLALPRLIGLPFAVLPGRAGITSRSHVAALAADTKAAVSQIVLGVVFLADTGWQMLDATLRTLWRLAVSRRRLLDWVTAAQAEGSALPGLAGSYRRMAGGLGLGLATGGAALLVNPAAWPAVLPLVALWFAAPAVALGISRPRALRHAAPLSPADAARLRLIARRTWRYFETFVTPTDSHLPPDNFQETPRPVVAQRTSPTNMGLYLLATTASHDLGWIGQDAALTRLEQTLHAMLALPRFRGHFFNWYDTRDGRVLDPPYVSTVDSGNLAGHLIAVAQACQDWQTAAPDDRDLRAGLRDTLLLARQALTEGADTLAGAELADLLDGMMAALADSGRLDAGAMLPDADRALALVAALTGPDAKQAARPDRAPPGDPAFWVAAIRQRLAEAATDARLDGPDLRRLQMVSRLARDMALAMEFGFLLDPEKKLLSIGFTVPTKTLDPNCYDLLASEARLASLFAIAKGDVETRHWFRLGRAATPLGAASALISWSGSMFEYLMPALVMRAPAGSVLEQTNRLVVARQRDYGASLDIPWGISESSFNARDLEMTYQYSDFGVPGLGLKRGLSLNRVIAPYATGLAAMVDPAAAAANYAALATLGAEGRYGFYEALDFTRSRLPEGAGVAIVRSFMAHHQGMTITAIANTLQGGRLRERFHAEPMIKGVDLLLQERVPRDAASAQPRAADVPVTPAAASDTLALRRFAAPGQDAPTAHLLSNGRFSTMLTPSGTGSSRWRNLAITRWRSDAGQGLGTFLFMRDAESGALWSAGLAPTGSDPARRTAVFCEHHAAFTHAGPHLTTTTEVVVSAEDDAEARRVTLTNTGRYAREVDVTSYAELVLAPTATDVAHPAFSKMFVVTDHLPELGVIIATRRRRSPDEPEVWAAHIAVVEGEETAPMQFETDRARFIGRGRAINTAVMAAAPLSGSTGTVLDPVFSIRRRLRVPVGGMARVTFWTIVAETPEALLDLVERHRDVSAYARAETLAWTQAQVGLRHLGVTPAAAADFQRLSGVLISGDARLRAGVPRILAGAGPQSRLWQLGISGDLPIVLLQIDDVQDIARVYEALAAHEYWRMRLFAVDLVILNDRASSYVQDLQNAIETAVRSAQSRPRAENGHHPDRGRIFALRTDLIPADARALLVAVAGAALVASRGGIGNQIAALPVPAPQAAPLPLARPLAEDSPESPPALEFFNGTGGFDDDGREYVTILRDGQTTPAPWLNVIANDGFGFQVSAEGSGHVWAENSRENQITPWSNDPVSDPAGEAIFLRDLDTGRVWTVTALPIRGLGAYTARHGFGYSRFSHTAQGIMAEMVQFVPPDDPVKISHLTLRNTTPRPRRLSVTGYAEWVLGASRDATLAHVITETCPETGAVLAHNPYATAFPGRVAFADLGADVASRSGDRAEVLGPNGNLAAPAGIAGPLSGRTGPALDPCAALQRIVTLAPGQTVEVTFLIGQAASAGAARALILRTRAADPRAVLAEVKRGWADLLGSVQVRSPDRAMDILLNGWLLYQTVACRIRARAGFYQASGAYGFRDQLQDGMALTAIRPALTRSHLLRAASRQFPEGDVQHWWLPHSGQGVRTRISDDRVWLGFGVAQYITVSGDEGILDEMLPFLEGPHLQPGAHDDFFQPGMSDEIASLFEHCARGIDQAIALTGANGMPLIGTGDWNDGMNRVGEGGQGTSVWLGWLLLATIARLAPLADSRDPERAGRWRAHAETLRAAIEAEGWDGAWYRRGTYDDGGLLGSAGSGECRIDSIAQSWAVLSGAADPARAAMAMESVMTHLVRPDPGLVLLFTPPFDSTPRDPGYIKGYPPGLRENGGQYSHAAMWAVLAQARLGNGTAAGSLFALLNPINHALTPADAQRYKVEPYVVAADVYSTAPHEGRGGWTWYTGSAGWMYRAGIEGILGLTRVGNALHIDPCFPAAWPRMEATLRQDGAAVTLLVENPGGTGHGIAQVEIDGMAVPHGGGPLILPLSDAPRRVRITLSGPVA
ncbi:glucoamylase family protein [Paracoccaceae bacterium Fryx2]|nr:glucoamylase family protein [Paracoccaceae bacterium Fryx2]